MQKSRGQAPVHLWNPPYCGEIDMRIARDGTWFYNGTPIGRPALVQLFASVLRKDPERFVLVTPVERVGIVVDDAPFLGVELLREGEGARQNLRLRTNVDEWVEISQKNPLKFLPGESGGLKPYVLVRGELWALVKRALFYDLVAWGDVRDVDGADMNGPFDAVDFSADFLARARAHLRQGWPDGAFDPLTRPHNGDHKLNAPLPGDAALLPTPARPAAVLALIVPRGGGISLLLTQRAGSLRDHSGQIAFPGGKIEPGESPLDAALREAEEEIGLAREKVEILGSLDPYQTSTGFRVFPLVGLAHPPFDLTINRQEVDEAFETPLSFLMNAANHQRHFREWQGKRRQFYAMPYENRYIWGATAGMIRNLYERLYL